MVRPVIVSATRQLSEAHYSTFPSDLEVRLNPGVRLADGDLEIIDEIGRGGLAVVYRALDHTRAGVVAVKIGVAKVDEERTRLRFYKEHRVGLMLGTHGPLVRPLRVGVLHEPAGFEGRPYLVTELVEGKPLDVIMAVHRHGLDVRRACAIGRDIGQALVMMHAKGIVHRDIKPGNVLVSGDDESSSRLIDFGLAHVRGDDWAEPSSGHTREASVSGTALYMAPEQALGHRPAPPADVYAFGAVLYEMFSGNAPFDRLPHAELLARKCDRTRSPISIRRMCSDLESRLAGLIDRCLSYDPSERPTAGELVIALGDRMANALPLWGAPRRPLGGYIGLIVLLSVFSAITMTAVLALLLTWPDERLMEARPSLSPPAPELPASPMLGVSSGPAPTVPFEAPNIPATGLAPATRPLPPSSASLETRTSKPTRKTHPSSARSPSSNRKADECPATVGKAKRAAIERQWGRVLRLTTRKECWTGKAASERALLRTQAYFETGRDADCVRSGQGLTNPQVVRWVRVCEANRRETRE